MDDELEQISKHINKTSQERKELAKKIRESNPDLIKTVTPLEQDKFKICGVDGGFLKKEYHGAGLFLRRAVAACFEYENKRLVNADYFPSKYPVPEPIFTSSILEGEFSTEANLRRVEIELETALQATLKFKPDMLVLDGSILIYPGSIPDKKSQTFPLYQKVVDLYKQLYSACKESDVLLIGTVEDSRSNRFCGLISEDTKDLSDTLLLYYMLNKSERTSHFKYSSNDNLPFLNDLGVEWRDCFYGMYLKSSEFDRPLRIEFLSAGAPESLAPKISAFIHHISKHNRYYCYPSVLIEADARAKLKEREIELFKQTLFEKTGYNPALFELRRETRPF